MIGFLGPKGTFTHIALQRMCAQQGKDHPLQAFSSVFSLFKALKKQDVEHIFVPIENSFGGDVFAANEGLLNLNEQHSIQQEVMLTIQQSLMTKSALSYAQITTLYAHEQSIRQCEQFIQTHLEHVKIISAASNAQAATIVAKSSEPVACLGHKQLASMYELDLLKEQVNDHKSNVTRFLLLSAEQTQSTGKDKSSFVFSTIKDRPGSLCDILQIMSTQAVNLTRISSRPSKQSLGEYLFFIDCEGHAHDSAIKNCLALIKQQSSYFKFLGSYPQGKYYD